jgi:hypothetical protein
VSPALNDDNIDYVDILYVQGDHEHNSDDYHND